MARDPTFAARHLALRALSSRPSREGEELLRRGLTDPDPLVRAESVHQCGARRGAAVLGDLARALGDREASVRLATAETLGLIRGGAADALLLRALDDRDPKVVQRAVRELAVRNCRAAEPALERLYPRSSCDVKADIATAFAWMDSPLADRYVRRWEQETGRRLEISSEWDN
jgi:hypothetical protein